MSADIGLARRAMACKRWRWMAGMLARGRSDVHFGTPPCSFRLIVDQVARWVAHPVPDMSDPATLGCMLALWMEAWPAESNDRAKRIAEIQDAIADHDIAKLAEAIVSALEAAP